ncbi:zinc ribbon domain-containing protein [Paenibacillus zeisoli]|uniref:Zinc ribbon domain-containing protein n=1 Tax=Paenibacillus zeisoli TaxID=2496267 RepID=A0A3S1JLM7_9BACL|nr:zinc ribbon domain-containing protein [Paenibacillus zeisoli]RUT28669.1 zinc ribbon domain-containing protein [Paenibacillus zeisoli]
MSFLDKFKAGVAEAGNKAKNVVEINRLKMQNNSMQNEMAGQYEAIGRIVFESMEEGSWPVSKEQVSTHAVRIQELQLAIEQNLLHIANINDSKTCKSCGATNNIEAKFCNHCGHTYEVKHNSTVEYETDVKEELEEGGHSLPDHTNRKGE